MPSLPTGRPSADATDDFLRARRRQALARLRARVARTPGDVDAILPFDEVVAALGRTGEVDLGRRVVALDRILGTVDRPGGFDREFRPTTSRVRTRWERIAEQMRAGRPLPPVDLYLVGEVYFVRDGHHRVSVARALGHPDIDARVVEVRTRVGATRTLRVSDLPLKDHERLFTERVPLPATMAARVRLSDAWQYAALAEGVEAWAFRAAQDDCRARNREEAAREWFEHEFAPVVELLRDAGMLGDGTDADAYIRVANQRYRLLRTHTWSDDILQALRRERRRA